MGRKFIVGTFRPSRDEIRLHFNLYQYDVPRGTNPVLSPFSTLLGRSLAPTPGFTPVLTRKYSIDVFVKYRMA